MRVPTAATEAPASRSMSTSLRVGEPQPAGRAERQHEHVDPVAHGAARDSIAARYAATVSDPLRSHVKFAATVSRAAAPSRRELVAVGASAARSPPPARARRRARRAASPRRRRRCPRVLPRRDFRSPATRPPWPRRTPPRTAPRRPASRTRRTPPPAPPRRGSAAVRGTGPDRPRPARPPTAPAPRRRGPSPITRYSGRRSGSSSAIARSTTSWRLRATRCATVTIRTAPFEDDVSGLQVRPQVHDPRRQRAPRDLLAAPRRPAAVRHHEVGGGSSPRRTPAGRSSCRTATWIMSGPCAETTNAGRAAPAHPARRRVPRRRQAVGVQDVERPLRVQPVERTRQRAAPSSSPSCRTRSGAAARRTAPASPAARRASSAAAMSGPPRPSGRALRWPGEHAQARAPPTAAGPGAAAPAPAPRRRRRGRPPPAGAPRCRAPGRPRDGYHSATTATRTRGATGRRRTAPRGRGASRPRTRPSCASAPRPAAARSGR